MRFLLFGNGQIADYAFIKPYLCKPYDKIICCDGGVRHTQSIDVTPDLIIGDLDSAPPDLIDEYASKCVPINKYPTQKNQSDMEIAIEYAISAGAWEIDIFGATGSRIDHEVSNLQLLIKAQEVGISAAIIDEKNIARVWSRDFTIDGHHGDIISLIPLIGKVTGVTTEGLFYPLNKFTLEPGSTRGISNVMTDSQAYVKISSGIILVVQTKD